MEFKVKMMEIETRSVVHSLEQTISFLAKTVKERQEEATRLRNKVIPSNEEK